MKKRLILLLMLCALASSVVSCKKNKDVSDTESQEVSQEEPEGITAEESATIEIGNDEQGAIAPE